ncbi:MAG: hypothetical protein AB7O66_15415 [Limisphaerales bacterium]
MNFRNRQHLLILVAALAVGLWVADQWILTPLIRSWKARSEKIAELRKSVARGQALIRDESEIRDSWDRARTNSLSLEPSIAENQLLKAFDAWSRESGVSISGLRPQWKRTEKDYATLECRADVSGNLPALTRFLFEAEIDPLGIRVESVELTTRDPNGSQLTLALQVSGLQLQRSKR